MSGAVAGVGVDAVDVERMRRILARTPSFAARFFTAAEQADAARRTDPSERLAARFAAKEATMKALGVGLGSFALAEVGVVRGEGGRPELALTGAAARLAEEHGVRAWHLSLTHTATVAVAVVVAER